MYLMELKTVQTNAIKVLVEALKEILTDANIEFNETGLKVVAMDSSKTILVHLKLNSDKFDKYLCKKKISIIVFYYWFKPIPCIPKKKNHIHV